MTAASLDLKAPHDANSLSLEADSRLKQRLGAASALVFINRRARTPCEPGAMGTVCRALPPARWLSGLPQPSSSFRVSKLRSQYGIKPVAGGQRGCMSPCVPLWCHSASSVKTLQLDILGFLNSGSFPRDDGSGLENAPTRAVETGSLCAPHSWRYGRTRREMALPSADVNTDIAP